MIELKFKCLGCGGHRIEEVMDNVTVASEIINIYEGGEVDYGEQTNSGGSIDRFQCVDCGLVIADSHDKETELNTCEDLYDLLKETGQIERMPTRKETLLSKLIDLCEDNEVMAEGIKKVFGEHFS